MQQVQSRCCASHVVISTARRCTFTGTCPLDYSLLHHHNCCTTSGHSIHHQDGNPLDSATDVGTIRICIIGPKNINIQIFKYSSTKPNRAVLQYANTEPRKDQALHCDPSSTVLCYTAIAAQKLPVARTIHYETCTKTTAKSLISSSFAQCST